MDFLNALPNTEHFFERTAQGLLQTLKPGSENSIPIAACEMWFDYDSPDFSHPDA